MKLKWEDIEAHRHVVSDLQWRRIRAYYCEGKTLGQISGSEKAKTSVSLSIGRGSMAILKALLQQPQAQTAPEPRAQAPSTHEPAAPVQTAGQHDGKQKHPTPRASDHPPRAALPRASGRKHTPASKPSPAPPRTSETGGFRPFADLERLLKRGAECAQPAPPAQPGIQPHMRIERHDGAARETGKVEEVLGEMAVVVWDSGHRSFAPVAALRPVSAEANTRASICNEEPGSAP